MININKASIELGGKQIITDFSDQIPAAAITVILGPNGSGKSTLLNAIAGDIKPTTGTITIDDINPALTPASQLSMLRAMAIQNQNYTLGFTVKQIIDMAGDSKEIIEALALTELADRQVTTLSGGEAQRVSIATAIAQKTPVLLLDEPLAAQDVESTERIIELLKSEAKAGKTIILVAHVPESELSWCDQIIKDF